MNIHPLIQAFLDALQRRAKDVQFIGERCVFSTSQKGWNIVVLSKQECQSLN